MKTESNMAQEAIFEVIENQLRDNNPPITKETYTRLMSEGHSHDETMKLIGCAMTTEIFEIMKNKQPFNEERYSQNLINLPDLPWKEE
jgi:peroxiredoxin family protein